MTREEMHEKVKALWPDHELTGLPMSAMGVLKILEALGVVKVNDFDDTRQKKIADEPKAVAAAITEAKEEVKEEEILPATTPPDIVEPVKKGKAKKNEG